MVCKFEDCRLRGRKLLKMALFATTLASGALGAGIATSVEGSTIVVNTVEDLYAAVNNVENAGAAVVLHPGVYTLSADRPNGGRLELQVDMSLSGCLHPEIPESCDRSAAVIDPSLLPDPSFRVASIPGRTGVIRVGRGSNAVEWLTIAGNRFAAAAIETDLVETGDDGPRPTTIRIAHVMTGDIARGVDVRNITATMAGRRLEADIADSDFFWGVEGIRVINFQGAHGGNISVAMRGNRSHANRLGCIIENNRSNYANISVVSSGDRFDDNGLGCQLGGALVGAAGGTASFNITKFEADGSEFTNNTRTEFNPNVSGPDIPDVGGILVEGGRVLGAGGPDATSGNTVVVQLWNTRVADNHAPDFQAYGARCTSSLCSSAGQRAGTDNHALIQLRGASAFVEVVAVDSEPVEPAGTNRVTVVRIP